MSLCENPFEGELNHNEVAVDNTCFKYARKYVVNLVIISDNINHPSISINITVPFILTMNSYPFNGKFIISPEVGIYNTTTFLIHCKNSS